MVSRWGWFSLWFFKRTEVIFPLVASLLQYLSALEVKAMRVGWGDLNLAAFPRCPFPHGTIRGGRMSCCRLPLGRSEAESRQRREKESGLRGVSPSRGLLGVCAPFPLLC